jgi:hypothetical protein
LDIGRQDKVVNELDDCRGFPQAEVVQPGEKTVDVGKAVLLPAPYLKAQITVIIASLQLIQLFASQNKSNEVNQASSWRLRDFECAFSVF